MPDPHHPPPPALRADDIDLTLLRTFLAAHRAGSMTKAAAELGLSQPGVTSQIRRLEQVGVTLFHRAGRGLTPTAAGDELALRIGPHLDALTAALNEAVTTDESPFTRTVLLGGPPELTAVRVLPSLTVSARARGQGHHRPRRRPAGRAGGRRPGPGRLHDPPTGPGHHRGADRR